MHTNSVEFNSDVSDDSSYSLIVDPEVFIQEKETLKSIIIQLEKKRVIAPTVAKKLKNFCQSPNPLRFEATLRNLLDILMHTEQSHSFANEEVETKSKHENELLKHNMQVFQKKSIAREKELELKINKLKKALNADLVKEIENESKYGSSSDDIPVASSLLVSDNLNSIKRESHEIGSATNDDNKMDVQLKASVSNDSEYFRTFGVSKIFIHSIFIKTILKSIIRQLGKKGIIALAKAYEMAYKLQDANGYASCLRDLLDTLKHAGPGFARRGARCSRRGSKISPTGGLTCCTRHKFTAFYENFPQREGQVSPTGGPWPPLWCHTCEEEAKFEHKNELLKHKMQEFKKKSIAREKELKFKIKRLEEVGNLKQ